MAPHRKPPITKICQHCGETYTRPDWKQWRASMYCSQECYTAARNALPPEERASLMGNATAKIRGSKRSHEDLCKRAQTKMQRCRLSRDEAEISARLYSRLNWLNYRLRPVPLYAVDKFNIDFAIPQARLAVEYHGGNWHNTPKKRRQIARKRAYLESQGWTVVEFPQLCHSRAEGAGNECIDIDDLVEDVVRLLHDLTPHLA